MHTGPMLISIVRNDERTAESVFYNHINQFLDEFVQTESWAEKTIAFDMLRDLLFTVDENEKTFLRKYAADYINDQWQPSLAILKLPENKGKAGTNPFFTKLNNLIKSRDYTNVAATVKLLQSILFCPSRATFETMLAYVNNRRNLTVAMNLIRDTAEPLQFEGFHLFKVFVVNPNRPDSVTTMLLRNRGELFFFNYYFASYHKNI